jgi:cytochrome c peroxidase
MSYLSRSLTVLDLVQQRWLAEVPVTAETLDADLLRGKILFNTATEPRLSRASWISCASCHPDAGSDGVTWIFPDGPRQTPALWNSGRTLPWHWSAALDEAHDVEETIQIIQQGVGLAPGADPPLLGQPLNGRSSDLDALAIFLRQGIRAPHVPPLGEESERGRQLFVSAGCADCHGSPEWTTSALPGTPGTLDADGNGMVDAALHDVGTATPLDLRGATGFDTPSLLGVGLTAPYFHDGSMPTLEMILWSGHPDPDTSGHQLTDDEVQVLAAFLRSIGTDTPPVTNLRTEP